MDPNTGIAFASTNAITQNRVPIPSQTPQVRNVLSVSRCRVLITLSITTLYMYLMPVWPKTRPEPSSVGKRMP